MPRDNGLPPSAAWTPLVEVDPPVVDQVLEVLRAAGIAARAEPVAGQRGLTAEVRPMDRPLERIWVDGARRDAARERVDQVLPALQADLHAAAVAEADHEAAARQARERLDLQWEAIAGRLTREGVGSDVVTTPPPPDVDPVDEVPEAERFVPPDPPPLPVGDPITRLGWLGIVLGPVLIVVSVILRIGPSWLSGLGLAALLAGFVTLVVRMPDTRHRDGDGWDDGAVV